MGLGLVVESLVVGSWVVVVVAIMGLGSQLVILWLLKQRFQHTRQRSHVRFEQLGEYVQ